MAACAPLHDLKAVLGRYDLGTLRSIEVFAGGRKRASKWLINSSKGTYLLKRRPLQPSRLARAQLSHLVQQRLEEGNYPLARLMATQNGQKTLLKDSQSIFELFTWVEGERCDGSPESIAQAGMQLARMHRLAGTVSDTPGIPPGGFHDADLVRKHLKMLDRQGPRDLAQHWRACVDRLMLHYNQASIHVNEWGFDSWPLQINHGDWHAGNLLYQGNEVVAVLDFDAVQLAPAVADVANGLLQFSLVAGDPQAAKWPAQADHVRLLHFWEGYCRITQLDSDRVQAIPDLMIETLIAETVLPIAATGIFDKPHGLDFMEMVVRKTNWLVTHRQALVRALESVQQGQDVLATAV